MKKLIAVLLVICLLPFSLISCADAKADKEYKKALELIDAKDYVAAYEILKGLEGHKEAEELLKHFYFGLATKELVHENGSNQATSSTRYVYTEDGLLSRTENNGLYQETLYYDENKRLIKVDTASGYHYEYAYDERGNLIEDTYYRLDTPWSGKEYVYDDNGNVIKETWLEINQSLLPMILPMEQRWVVEYTYDESGKLITRVEDGSTTVRTVFVYDDNGQLIREEKHTPNGVSILVTYTYDSAGNLVKKENNGGSSIDYTYDENGNLTKEDGSRYTYEYTYDNNDLLIKEVRWENQKYYHDTVTTIDYSYDENGNLIRKITDYRRGKSHSVRTYSYDTNGNLIDFLWVHESDTSTITEHVTMTYTLLYIPHELHDKVIELMSPPANW